MWFKNVRAYRLTSPFSLSAEQLETQLAQRGFQHCAATQPVSLGWVPALGADTEALVHPVDGRFLLRLRREERLLPSTVVREQLAEKVAAIEDDQGRKVYRKERMTLQDEIVLDFLPRAFTRSSYLYAYIDTRANWVFVDATSAARAEEFLNLLRECIGTFPVVLPQVNNAPTATMTAWLAHQSLPDDFALGEECELREPGDEGGVVRCRGVDLLGEEVETHLNAGKQVARLALHWEERLSLVLAEDLCLRRLKFSDELMKENEDLPEADRAARLDADFALMSDLVTRLQTRVIDLFGGEME
ncbi:MAG: recombination-associated protein RdgC [Haliea sp.]|uniref:recombination-associated protein RdgC n=1 Tax=Haliea sp. TaxID=1932666 RepID=UPI000C619B2E|nr:recombination-associated protein RdgC [Haliea sp.]MBM69085.1 recombination-associated protein RdgC [Haliea sp.]|tara:strand:- start:23873 stop:24778 length:906 start_codon:yes stop_codon:yes gene_type:complete